MTGNRKGALKAIAVFLVTMAALTFFSRTIYFSMLPKVQAVQVKGGVLTYRYASGQYILDSDKVISVSVEEDLSDDPLRVESVSAVQFARVKAGEILLSFDETLGERAYTSAVREAEQAQEAQKAWEHNYREEWERLAQEQLELQASMREADANLEQIKYQLEVAQRAQQYLEQSQIADGISQRQVENGLTDAKGKLEKLESIRNAKWTIVANEDCLISQVLAEEGQDYLGLAPLIRYIPASSKIRIGIECPNEPYAIDAPAEVTVRPAGTILGDSWQYDGAERKDDKRVVWAILPEDMPDLQAIKQLEFQFTTEYLKYLVPNSALAGGNLYLLETRLNGWGQEEYYAQSVALKNIEQDDEHTYVSDGLSGSSMVITAWDRPINDGDVVALPLK